MSAKPRYRWVGDAEGGLWLCLIAHGKAAQSLGLPMCWWPA
jgi:hypothetical protein